MKRIKTDTRNRFSTTVLDNLMRISINGPELGNFDLEKAATKMGCNKEQTNSCLKILLTIMYCFRNTHKSTNLLMSILINNLILFGKNIQPPCRKFYLGETLGETLGTSI